MQDDAYLIAADGWRAETSRVIVKDKKGTEKDKGWTCDLISKPLIVQRYFADEQAAIDQLSADLESIAAKLLELEEEQGGEDGAFSELDKVNKTEVSARWKETKSDPDAADEAAVLKGWLDLKKDESSLKAKLKAADKELYDRACAQYPKLTEFEIKTLVVDDKWMATLEAALRGELDRVSQRLTQRVKELADRYASPLPQMANRVAELEAKVDAHLEKMGFSW